MNLVCLVTFSFPIFRKNVISKNILLQVFLVDGSIHSFGMESNDTQRVVALEVPENEHIKTFQLRCGWYIDALGFETNKGKKLGLIGGDGGDRMEVNYALRDQHHYIDGIKGITLMTQGEPCICELQFKFIYLHSDRLYSSF